MTIPARARIAAAVAAATVALTGCTYTNPITTQIDYPASDGVQVRVGDVFAHNLLIFAEEEDGFAFLGGSVTNEGRDDVTVTVVWEGGADVSLEIPARSTVILGPHDNQTFIAGSAPVIPGLKTDVEFQTDLHGNAVRDIKIVDGTLEHYRAKLDAGLALEETLSDS